jgi:4-hydroxy-tetrahydrodipicolinate synthase
MLYNKPIMVVRRVSLQLLERLADLENVVAMKDVTFDPWYFPRVVRRLGGRLAIVPWTVGSYSLWAFQLGCPGTTATIPNFAPETSVAFYEAYVRGDLKRAWELARVFDLFHELWRDAYTRWGGPLFINYSKKAMELLEMPSGPVRESIRVEIPKDDVERLIAILRELGLLEG